MDLLDRYLAEVRRNLPARDAHDIVAELRDLLIARAEDQQEEKGTVDWSALLRDFGHPLVIAARYRKQQWLISPDLFPFYLHFLKMIVVIVLAVVTGLALVRGALWGSDPGQEIAGYLGSLWWSAASSVGAVTIVFALLDRFGGGAANKCRDWKPSELPEVSDTQPSIYESVFEIGIGLLLIAWWFRAIPTPQWGHEGFRLVAGPVWQPLFWSVGALLISQLAFNLVRRLRPRWTAVRATLGVVNAVTVVAIAATLYRAGRIVTVVSNGMSADQVASLQTSIDLAFRMATVVGLVVFVFNMGAELWRMTRRLRGRRIGGTASAV